MGLTLLRLLLLPVFLWVMVRNVGNGPPDVPRPGRWLALAIFAVMAITDKLDGYLARRLGQSSKLGAILDPVADKLLIACSTVLLSFDAIGMTTYHIRLWVVAAIYGKDLFLALGTVGLLAYIGHVTISPRLPGKISTVVQLALVIATLIAPDLEKCGAGAALGLLRFLWWTVLVLAPVVAVDYARQGYLQLRAARRLGVVPQQA
jgi:CDP-diacylglycerol--glycerol-3-phosphate 3-phosphatidyltransferase